MDSVHEPDDQDHFLVLADDGFLSTGDFRSPMCLVWSQPRTTSAAKLVSWWCAQSQRALAGLDADLDESRAAALIALIGGLDGHRRDVI